MKVNYLSILFLFLFFSCVSDEEKEKPEVEFDQSGMLSNLSGQVIVPAFFAYYSSANTLSAKLDSFEMQMTSTNLIALQQTFINTYEKWQGVNLYDFGPMESRVIKSATNTYPCDTNLINQNAAIGNVNVDLLSNRLSRGLPAIDYLLFQKELSFFSDSNHFKLLEILINDLVHNANALNADWSTFQNEFNSKEGTDLGSSAGILVNALNKHIEQFFRDAKLGIPIGIRSAGIERPSDAEAFYSQISFNLLQKNFIAIKDTYTGKAGLGLDDFLLASDAAALNEVILSQMTVIESKLNSFSGPLPAAIQADKTRLQECYNEIQKLIVYLKVDLPSRLGILISYQDNDGD